MIDTLYRNHFRQQIGQDTRRRVETGKTVRAMYSKPEYLVMRFTLNKPLLEKESVGTIWRKYQVNML